MNSYGMLIIRYQYRGCLTIKAIFAVLKMMVYANCKGLVKKIVIMSFVTSVLLSFAFLLPTMTYYTVAAYRYGAYDHEINGDLSAGVEGVLLAQQEIDKVVSSFKLSSANFKANKGGATAADSYFFPEHAASNLPYSVFSECNLFKGRYPRREGEVSVSTTLARVLRLRIGDRVQIQYLPGEHYLAGKIVGVYSLDGQPYSAISIISDNNLQDMGQFYYRNINQYLLDNDFYDDYPLLENPIYNWLWVSTSLTDVQLHNIMAERLPDDYFLVLSRESEEMQVMKQLEFKPPVVVAISLIGLITLLIISHREAVSTKEAYMPIRALLGMLGARHKTLRTAVVLYELLGLLVSSFVAYNITVNINLGLFYGLDLPRLLRPWLILSQAVICGIILIYTYMYTIIRARRQLQVLADLRWEL